MILHDQVVRKRFETMSGGVSGCCRVDEIGRDYWRDRVPLDVIIVLPCNFLVLIAVILIFQSIIL